MTHLPQCFGLDLADPFPGHSELASNFFQSAAVAVDQAKTLLEDLPLSLGQGFQNIFDLFL